MPPGSGPLLSKGEHRIFNMCNEISVCCAHHGETGTDQSILTLTIGTEKQPFAQTQPGVKPTVAALRWITSTAQHTNHRAMTPVCDLRDSGDNINSCKTISVLYLASWSRCWCRLAVEWWRPPPPATDCGDAACGAGPAHAGWGSAAAADRHTCWGTRAEETSPASPRGMPAWTQSIDQWGWEKCEAKI